MIVFEKTIVNDRYVGMPMRDDSGSIDNRVLVCSLVSRI